MTSASSDAVLTFVSSPGQVVHELVWASWTVSTGLRLAMLTAAAGVVGGGEGGGGTKWSGMQ